MKCLRLKQDADPTHGPADFPKPLAVECGDPGAVVETHHQAHRRRLPGTVGPKEAGDETWADVEREIVNRATRTESLRQPHCFDQRGSPFAVCSGKPGPEREV